MCDRACWHGWNGVAARYTKIENAVSYLGVDSEDALLLAERTEIQPLRAACRSGG